MPVTLPDNLKPYRGGYAQTVRNLGGGQSITGFEQVVGTMQDRWSASFTFAIRKDAQVLALRAFLMQCGGRRNQLVLPAFDLARAPWQIDPYGRPVTPKFARKPVLDGTQYEDPGYLRRNLIQAVTSEDAEQRATVVEVLMTVGSKPTPGQYLKIRTRMHAVQSAAGSGPYVLTIWPPLREDIASGTAVDFSTPSCVMRLASDVEGQDALRSLDGLRHADVTLNFDEWPA